MARMEPYVERFGFRRWVAVVYTVGKGVREDRELKVPIVASGGVARTRRGAIKRAREVAAR